MRLLALRFANVFSICDQRSCKGKEEGQAGVRGEEGGGRAEGKATSRSWLLRITHSICNTFSPKEAAGKLTESDKVFPSFNFTLYFSWSVRAFAIL